MLRKIVVDAERMPAAVAKILADGAARIGSDVLHGRGIGGGGGNDNRIFHRAVFFKRSHYLRNGRPLLSDSDVNADHVAALLIDDGVENDGGFSGLAIADDQLALA